MNESPVISRAISAAYMIPAFVLIKFLSALVLGRLYFQLPYSLGSELIAVAAAYLIVEATMSRWKAKESTKIIVLGAIILLPLVLAKVVLH